MESFSKKTILLHWLRVIVVQHCITYHSILATGGTIAGGGDLQPNLTTAGKVM